MQNFGSLFSWTFPSPNMTEGIYNHTDKSPTFKLVPLPIFIEFFLKTPSIGKSWNRKRIRIKFRGSQTLLSKSLFYSKLMTRWTKNDDFKSKKKLPDGRHRLDATSKLLAKPIWPNSIKIGLAGFAVLFLELEHLSVNTDNKT